MTGGALFGTKPGVFQGSPCKPFAGWAENCHGAPRLYIRVENGHLRWVGEN